MLTKPRISKVLFCGASFMIFMLAGLPQLLAAGEDKVLARIGNETVTEQDLNEMSNAVPERFRQYLHDAGRATKDSRLYRQHLCPRG